MRSVPNKKPVARVLPSPQQVTKSESTLSDQLESASNTVCDNKPKDKEESTHSDNVSSIQPSPVPIIDNNKDVEHDKKNEKDVKISKDDDLAKTECDSSKQNWVVSDSLPLPSTPSPPTMFGPPLPPDLVQSSSHNWIVSDMNERLVSRKKKHSHKKTVSVSKESPASPDDSSADSSDTDGGRKTGKDARHKEEKKIKRKRVKEKKKNRSKEKESRDHFKEKSERDRSKRDTIKEREDPKKRDDSNERDNSKHHRQMKKRRHRDRSSSDESEEEVIETKRRKLTEHSHKKRKKHHSKRHSHHSESSDDESNDGRHRKRQKSPSPFTPSHSKQWKKRNEKDRGRGREKDELLREKATRKMQELRRMKESDKLFDDCLKNKGMIEEGGLRNRGIIVSYCVESSNVTEIKWDSKRSSHRHDSTSSDEPNVLDSLDKSDQLGDGGIIIITSACNHDSVKL